MPQSRSIVAVVSSCVSFFLIHHVHLYTPRIPSVSSELPASLDSIRQMIDWTAAHITRLGGKVDLKPNPAATAERDLPPILLAEFMVDPKKKTLCVYG